MNEVRVAKILIVSQAQTIDKLFDYIIPESLAQQIAVGARVLVPFQNRPNLGYVWETTDRSDFSNLKSIQELIDPIPLISDLQYRLINWLADYYFCSRGDVIKLCMPPGANLRRESYYILGEDLPQIEQFVSIYFPEIPMSRIIKLIVQGTQSKWPFEQWYRKFAEFPHVLSLLTERKILTPEFSLAKSKVKVKTVNLYQWKTNQQEFRETAAALRVKEVLTNHPDGLSCPEVCAAASVSSSVVNRLVQQGFVCCTETTIDRKPAGFRENCDIEPIILSLEQQKILISLTKTPSNQLFLLHGVTGSGKTEIYFETAAHILAKGLQVLYLVPEIALTPQTLKRAQRRFGAIVALLHSNMSDGERFDQWFRIKNGTARFVLGTRSALFAPFEKLGLIIMDEEHENSYKQEETPRYHAREVAEKLSEFSGANVIFGSATPSLESFYSAQNGKYHYSFIGQRYNSNPLPEVQLVDMRQELQSGNRQILSRSLQTGITECLENNEQVILLLNRRGYSTFILCRDCGQALRCPACDISLTYHIHETILRCHYCDYRQPIPDICPNCQGNRIRYFGHGTQKLEEELNSLFPGTQIVRMDLDSTARKGAHYEIYQQLIQGKADILLGTQMVAKGLDLPKVTLVGVIAADATLNVPDFRAAERTFQLLTQVAGRAGRGQKPGHVIFQTYNPEHYSLELAKNHDYLKFYEKEISFRQELDYPPFSELIRISFTGLNIDKVQQSAEIFHRLILKIIVGNYDHEFEFVNIMGPTPALIPKLQNKYRWQIIFKSAHTLEQVQIIKQALQEFPRQKFMDVKIVRDRNPYSVM